MKFFYMAFLFSAFGLTNLLLAGDDNFSKKITVEFQEKQVKEVLKNIENLANVKISVPESLIENLSYVNYEAKDDEAGRIICRILKSRGLEVTFKSNNEAEVSKANPADEFKIKPEQTFEFAEKPTIKKDGDSITISFETKSFCDVTIAIEDSEGKILRHLANGVLGVNAPHPFQWNSKKQKIVWDSKDDQGVYVANKGSISVRVSLGLKPLYEKTLYWDPGKRNSSGWNSGAAPIMKSTAEGVYVYEAGVMERLRLFDHDGKYIRTIYPFAADKWESIKGIQTHTFPHTNKKLPLKAGFEQSSLLMGKNASKNPRRSETGLNAVGFAIQGKNIALAGNFISRFSADGSNSNANLGGTKVVIQARMQGSNQSVGNDGTVRPTSLAFSPDGKFLYLTGYMWRYSWHNDSYHGVMKVSNDTDNEPELFVGSMKQDDSGSEDGKFKGATSVACDNQGRVYVTDHCNDRVQVFDSNGKFLKAIPVFRPAIININPKNNEIYVFSWMTPNRFHLKLATENEKNHKPPTVIEPKLFKLGTFENPIAANQGLNLPLPKFGGSYSEWWNLPPMQYVGEVDFNSETPTIWLAQATDNNFKGNWESIGIQLLREKNGKLEIFKDFGKDVVENISRAKPPMLDRQRLYTNPKNGKLYVGEADSGVGKAFTELVEIDPESGKTKMIKLPFSTEDMAFDVEGNAYLRSDPTITRYDSNTWKEIPWDYGEEKPNVAFEGNSPPVLSTLSTPGHRSPSFWHMGGIYINVKGHVAITCPNPNESLELVPGEENKDIKTTGKKYEAPLFAGRLRWGEVHIWDKHGKLILEDVLPGLGHLNGIGLDASDNLYVMANGHRLFEGKPYDPNLSDDLSETLIKAKPKAAKFLSSNGNIGLPLKSKAPKRPHDFVGFPTGATWVDGAEWFYGGIGYTGNAGWDGGGCRCWNARFTLDYFARSFAPETRHFSVAVLDSNGNLITRIGRYGNVDDGKPLVAAGGPANPKSIGGDEVALFHAAYVGTITDKRLFIADAGNFRIVSVKIAYATEEKLEVPSK